MFYYKLKTHTFPSAVKYIPDHMVETCKRITISPHHRDCKHTEYSDFLKIFSQACCQSMDSCQAIFCCLIEWNEPLFNHFKNHETHFQRTSVSVCVCVLYQQMFSLALVNVIAGLRHTWCVNRTTTAEDDDVTRYTIYQRWSRFPETAQVSI